MFPGRNTGLATRAMFVCLATAVFLGSSLPLSSGAAKPTSAPPPKRWMQFELMESEASGVVRVDKDLVLSITVGGITTSSDSILAIIESAAFQSQTVSLNQDSNPTTYQGTAILEPNFASKSLTVRVPFFKEGMKDNAATTAKLSSSGGQVDLPMKLISDEMGNHFEATTTLTPTLQAVLRKGQSLTLRVEGETQSFPLAGGQKGFAVMAQRCGG